MKKKSLLLAIAAMSMAAVGVGTVGTFAWFQSSAEISNSHVAQAGTLTAATTDATNAGLKWTVTHKTASLENIQLTDNAGKTGYWDNGAKQAVTGIDPTTGYGSVTYHVAVELVNGGSMTLAQALTSYYNANIGSADKLYLYVRVTNGSQARIADAAADVYKEAAEDHQTDAKAVTFAFELSSTGVTTSWDVAGTLYASIKANTGNDGVYSTSNAAEKYENATISATVGTSTAAF